MRRFVPQLIFLYLIYLQVISIYDHNTVDPIKIFKLSLFQLALFPALLYASVKLVDHVVKRIKDSNRGVINSILLYSLYQVLVILPLTYFETNLTVGSLVESLTPRLCFLLILFIYWYVLPSFSDVRVPINWLAYSSVVMLVLILYNYKNGIYSMTNTGELRLVSGVAVMIFAFAIITKLSIFSHEKNNAVLIAISLAGFVFVNHRSGYLVLALVFFLSIFVSVKANRQGKLKPSRVIVSVLILLLLVISLSQIPLIRDNFTGRVASSLDVSDPNATDRMMRWRLAFDFFLQNPINGSKLEDKYYADNVILDEYYPPHNFVFETLSTQGIVGFSLIAFIMLGILRIAYRNRSDAVSHQMFIMIVFYLLFSLMNVTFLHQMNILVLAFAAAVVLHQNRMLRNEGALT